MTRGLAAVLTAALLLLGVSAVLAWRGADMEAAIAESREQQATARMLADELRQSSDDLTRMARTYAVTGDERYRQYFQEILAIRNGERPRPRDYHLAYWDLVTAEDGRPPADGDAVALRARMEAAGFTAAELALLEESEDESNALTALERDAFAAVGRGDLQAARDLLHSDAYHQAKARIMLPIQRFVQAMDDRTSAETARLAQRRDSLNRYLLAATGLALALVAGALLASAAAGRRSP